VSNQVPAPFQVSAVKGGADPGAIAPAQQQGVDAVVVAALQIAVLHRLNCTPTFTETLRHGLEQATLVEVPSGSGIRSR
jgi:hypothetical protein